MYLILPVRLGLFSLLFIGLLDRTHQADIHFQEAGKELATAITEASEDLNTRATRGASQLKELAVEQMHKEAQVAKEAWEKTKELAEVAKEKAAHGWEITKEKAVDLGEKMHLVQGNEPVKTTESTKNAKVLSEIEEKGLIRAEMGVEKTAQASPIQSA